MCLLAFFSCKWQRLSNWCVVVFLWFGVLVISWLMTITRNNNIMAYRLLFLELVPTRIFTFIHNTIQPELNVNGFLPSSPFGNTYTISRSHSAHTFCPVGRPPVLALFTGAFTGALTWWWGWCCCCCCWCWWADGPKLTFVFVWYCCWGLGLNERGSAAHIERMWRWLIPGVRFEINIQFMGYYPVSL